MLVAILAVVRVVGNWSDSYLNDEISIFANMLDLEISVVKSTNADDVLGEVKKCWNPFHLALMDYTLRMRTLHAKASVRNRKVWRPQLRGWFATKDVEREIDLQDVAPKGISYLFTDERSDNSKWEIIKSYTHNFFSVANNITDTPIDEHIVRKYEEDRKEATDIVLINGRVVKGRTLEIADVILEEAVNLEMTKRMNFSDCDADSLHFSYIKNHRIFMPMPQMTWGAVVQDALTDNKAMVNEVDASSENIVGTVFMRLVNVHYFAKVGDVSSIAFLKAALEFLKNPRAMCLTVFPVVNIMNHFERRVIFAFYMIKSKYTAREAVRFLVTGLKTGYERAYMSFKIAPEWDHLDGIMTPRTEFFGQIAQLSNYIAARNITETILLVNGQPYVREKISTEFRTMCAEVNKEMRGYAKKGLLDIHTHIGELLSNQSIVVDKMNHLRLVTEDVKYLSFHRQPVKNQRELMENMGNGRVIYEAGSQPRVQVVAFGDDNVFDALIHDLLNVNISIGYEIRITTDCIVPGAVMTIGGRLIDNVPDVDAFLCLLRAVHFEFYADIPPSLSAEQVRYWALWKGSMKALSISRSEHIYSELCVSKVGGPLQCELVYKVSSVNCRELVAVFDELVAFNIVSLKFTPVFSALYSLPVHMKQEFYPQFAHEMNMTNEEDLLEMHFPEGWIVIKQDGDWVVTAVTVTGTSNASCVIGIGSEVRQTLSNGFFSMPLSVGIHETKFLSPGLVEVSSLSVHDIGFVQVTEVGYAPEIENDTLNVFSFANGRRFDDHITMMMSTLLEHATCKVKFWIIGVLHSELPANYSVAFLSPVLPNLDTLPLSPLVEMKLAKLINIDIYFPPSVSYVLFCDSGTVWTGDAARFMKLDMKNTAIALPDISNMNTADSSMFFMDKAFLEERFYRPFHTTSMFYVKMSEWRRQNAFTVITNIYNKTAGSRSFVAIDNELINIAQAVVQILSLPGETAFCDKYSSLSKLSEAVAISLCSSTSISHTV